MNTLTATLPLPRCTRPSGESGTYPRQQHRPGGDESAHPPPVARRHRPDAAAPGLAQHPGHDGPGIDRPDRDLVGLASRHRRSHRHGAGLPRLHDDDHAGRWRDRRRHFVRGGPCTRRRSARRCRCAGLARHPHQPGARHCHVGVVPDLRTTDLQRHGRPRRLARGGAEVLERGLRRQRPDLADERAGQRHPRHRQHARSLAGDLPRRRPAGAALARAHLRPRADPGARHRRRRSCRAADDDADDGGAGLVHPLGPLHRPVTPGASQLADVCRHPARRRGRCDQHAADLADGRPDDRTGGPQRRPPMQSPATARVPVSNTC